MKLPVLLALMSLISCSQTIAQDPPRTTRTSTATDTQRNSEIIYYRITLEDSSVSIKVPDAKNFLVDPVATLKRNGFTVPEQAERHWQSLAIAIRRLANPNPSKQPSTPIVARALVDNQVLELQLHGGLIPVVGEIKGDVKDFLVDPVARLRALGVKVPAESEGVWQIFARSLRSLRNDYANLNGRGGQGRPALNADGSANSEAKEREAGVKDLEAETEKQRPRSQGVSGRITSVVVDPSEGDKSMLTNGPDLVVKQFQFPPTNDKSLRVQVQNQGNAEANACRLLLTVNKINGTTASRKTQTNIPELAPGQSVWLVVDAKSILPVNVSIAAVSFKLSADGTGIVAESNENNNELEHKE